MVTDPPPQGKAGEVSWLAPRNQREGCNFLLEWPYFASSSREYRLWRKRAFC
jgi:hypothetical protein